MSEPDALFGMGRNTGPIMQVVKPMKMLIADDHELVRYALRVHLNAMGEVEIVEAQNYQEILGHAGDPGPFDLLLIDINMPDVDADFTVSLGRVRAAFPDAKVVVFSASSDAATVSAALRTGIQGFVVKTTRGTALVSALRIVLDGEIYVPSSIMDHISSETIEASRQTRLPALSEREASCLRLLGEGLRNKEIARVLKLQENTVKIHLRGVFRKLGAANRIDAVRIALDRGLLGNAARKADD